MKSKLYTASMIMMSIAICFAIASIIFVITTLKRPPEVVRPIPTEPLLRQELAAIETPAPAPEYSDEELEILAIIIYQEAGGDACSDSTRQMVGEVFLNRVADPRFPDTFVEVATQKRQYGSLYWTGITWPERATKPGEAHAVARAYSTAEALLSGEVDRLLPSDAIWQAEFEQGNETLAQQDGLYFCR